MITPSASGQQKAASRGLYALLLTASWLLLAGVKGAWASDPRPRDSSGWVSCSSAFTPLNGGAAAALVSPAVETISQNTTANHYQPSAAEISAFLNNERDSYNQLPSQSNPYYASVTGGFTGTTDEIIQWGAAKWGINPDWLRAEYVQESTWRMSQLGDLTTVSNVLNYPAFSRFSGTQVYQSLGITQVKWNHPDANNTGIGTEPLRWESTAFNIDYQGATLRFYFDNPQNLRSAWGDATYSSCNNWLSLGGWFEPYPWNNTGQQNYISLVQNHLANRDWTSYSSSGDKTAPSAPTNLAAAGISSTQINLSWSASADNVGVTGYRIERCQGSGCSDFSQIAISAGTSYADTGLSSSTSYTYRVRAHDAVGNFSAYSNSVVASPRVSSACDLNADGSVNAADLQTDVNAILTGSTSTTYDINKDNVVNVLDAQVLANVILGTRSCP